MKIIKRGSLPEEKVYQATCNVCKTEVEFERKEAKYHSDLHNGDCLEMACPVCTHAIYKAI